MSGQADATLLEFPCGAILIDAGAQDTTAQTTLIQYLQHFFARRTDLHNTLDLVVISHDHVDHDITLPRVAQTFTIKHYIDNGHTNANNSGEPMQTNIGPPIQTFSTYAYGHPRIVTLDALQQSIPGNRPQAITVKAASAQYTFSDYTVTKNIYATAWDGNVTIHAVREHTPL